MKMPLARLKSCFLNVRPMTHTRIASIMWPAGFEDPLPHKSSFLEAKDNGDYKRKTLVPVKAAPNDATCSVLVNPLFIKFQRAIMKRGEKFIAANISNKMCGKIKEIQLKKYYSTPEDRRHLVETNPVTLVVKAVENAKPLMNLEKVKVGSVEYTVPTPISDQKSTFLAISWIMTTARGRDHAKQLMYERLAELVVETAHDTGPIINMKNEHHKQCEINRAYAHYRRSG